jgi:hypothetical protein
MVGGILMISVGGLSAIGGLIAIAVGSVGDVDCNADYFGDAPRCTQESDEDVITGGQAFAVGGLILAVAGIPVLIYGASRVPRRGATTRTPAWSPDIQLSPTGGSLTWRF